MSIWKLSWKSANIDLEHIKISLEYFHKTDDELFEVTKSSILSALSKNDYWNFKSDYLLLLVSDNGKDVHYIAKLLKTLGFESIQNDDSFITNIKSRLISLFQEINHSFRISIDYEMLQRYFQIKTKLDFEVYERLLSALEQNDYNCLTALDVIVIEYKFLFPNSVSCFASCNPIFTNTEYKNLWHNVLYDLWN